MEAYNSYNYTCINKNRYKKLDGENTFFKVAMSAYELAVEVQQNLMRWTLWLTFTLPNSPQPIIKKVSFARNLDIFL